FSAFFTSIFITLHHYTAFSLSIREKGHQKVTFFDRLSPLIEISGLKSYEIIVCYRNLSAIAKFQTHFWRKLGVNWRKLWRKHRQFKVNQ
ncbi:hypothetical protein ACTNEA_06655, partial [Oscillospiraceae bacterium HCP3S3_F4]